MAEVAATLWVSPGDRIDTDMGLHVKEILVTFPGLFYLRITLLGLVIGGGCGRHYGGVGDGTLVHEQALLSQAGVDFLENTLG